MSDYFKWFPTITYNNQTLLDITRRVKIFADSQNDPYLFVPYTVVYDDRPEDIAYYYYGDASKVWIVYLANNIIDPYKQWPLRYDDLQNYIIKKYQSQSGTNGFGVINWAQSNISHYQNVSNTDITITKDTYTLDNNIVIGDWTGVSYYDYEQQLNEDKRNIWLINADYVSKAEEELQLVLNGG